MVTPAPLKDKSEQIRRLDDDTSGRAYVFLEEDVAAAVEWLKQRYKETLGSDAYAIFANPDHITIKDTNKLIDEAFADVVHPFSTKAVAEKDVIDG